MRSRIGRQAAAGLCHAERQADDLSLWVRLEPPALHRR